MKNAKLESVKSSALQLGLNSLSCWVYEEVQSILASVSGVLGWKKRRSSENGREEPLIAFYIKRDINKPTFKFNFQTSSQPVTG